MSPLETLQHNATLHHSTETFRPIGYRKDTAVHTHTCACGTIWRCGRKVRCAKQCDKCQSRAPLEQLQHNATLRHHTETLADYVIRLTDTYMRRESDVEFARRTGRTS